MKPPSQETPPSHTLCSSRILQENELTHSGQFWAFCLVDTTTNILVFFMADVMELRMELIFPRSTLSKLTPSGEVGALRPAAGGAVSGVGGAGAEAGGVVLGDLVVVSVSVSFIGTLNFVILKTAGDAVSVLSPTGKFKADNYY